jgi:hypothetical protein
MITHRLSPALGIWFALVSSLVCRVDSLSAQPSTNRTAWCASSFLALTAGSTESDQLDGLWLCPNAVPVIDAALNASRATTDSTRLALVFGFGSAITDQTLATTALSIATDVSASELARSYALVMLAVQVTPAAIAPELSDGGPDGLSESCMLDQFTTSTSVRGIPISPVLLNSVLTASTALYRGTQNSARIRYLANCVWHQTRRLVSPTVQVSDIQLTYLCGNRFRIRNRNFVPVRVRWNVYNTTDQGEIVVRGAGLVTPPYDQTFTTTTRGTTRLFVNGALIQTKANGGSTCTTLF